MAFTATATCSLHKSVEKNLGMKNTVVVELSPDKPNIFLLVKEVDGVKGAFLPVVECLKNLRTGMGRIIIFCQTRDECPMLYSIFLFCLGKEFTEPPGMPPQLPQYHLVDYFTSGTHESTKEDMIKLFTSTSPLCIVISTIAFGLGVNCSDVREIIHFGPPQTVEEYVRHIGQAGRNGERAVATLCHGKGLKSNVDTWLKQYCGQTTECRRDFLFRDFDSYRSTKKGCHCCDICVTSCTCENCITMKKSLKKLLFLIIIIEKHTCMCHHLKT